MQCFALLGFIGLDLSIVETKRQLAANQMNEWRPRYGEPKQKLPQVGRLTRLQYELSIVNLSSFGP